MDDSRSAVILVGHGGVPSDAPRGLVEELKRLEAQRRARGLTHPEGRELEVDHAIRTWPRTPETDPYRFGLEALGAELRERLPGRSVALAFNGFCTPCVDEAIDDLAGGGARRITLLTTMVTPGGRHSELEIPEIVEAARPRHPGTAIEYAWPFDLGMIADLLATQLASNRRWMAEAERCGSLRQS